MGTGIGGVFPDLLTEHEVRDLGIKVRPGLDVAHGPSALLPCYGIPNDRGGFAAVPGLCGG
jgi:hypothetical protein